MKAAASNVFFESEVRCIMSISERNSSAEEDFKKRIKRY